jgi:hypothetical protein
MKNPWLAAILNALIPGLGYLYIRKRILFGALLIGWAFAAIVWVSLIPEEIFNQIFWNVWGVLAMILLAAAFAIDAYKEARS